MPMLADVKTSRPPIENGALSASWMRKAITFACCSSIRPFSRIANSSPPSRASDVALAQAPFEAARDGDQQLVADQVTEAVVDHLEPVEIEVEHGEPIAVAPLLEVVEPPAQSFDEQRAIAQAGQRVQEPDAAQPLLRERAFGRVGQRSGHPHRPLPCPSHRDAAAHEPAIAAVLVAQAMLVLEVLGRARQVRVERLLERLGILRMNAAESTVRNGQSPPTPEARASPATWPRRRTPGCGDPTPTTRRPRPPRPA